MPFVHTVAEETTFGPQNKVLNKHRSDGSFGLVGGHEYCCPEDGGSYVPLGS